MKIIFNEETKQFRRQMYVSVMPQGFTEITSLVKNPSIELEDRYLEIEFVEEVPFSPAVAAYWTNGVNIVNDVNDIPTIVDENNEAVLEEGWDFVPAKEEIIGVSAHYILKKTATADQELRAIKMQKLSELREPLLKEADIEINKLEDKGESTVQWRVYRQALRDITEIYKKVNGEWKVSVDSLVLENFQFPAKP